MLLVLGCTNDSKDTAPEPCSNPVRTDIASETLVLINQHRASLGLGALGSNNHVLESAIIHSCQMSTGLVEFGHAGFDDRVVELRTIIDFDGVAENVLMNQGLSDPAKAAVEAWLDSPGHKANIEGDYNQTGIGVVESSNGQLYFTQIFIE